MDKQARDAADMAAMIQKYTTLKREGRCLALGFMDGLIAAHLLRDDCQQPSAQQGGTPDDPSSDEAPM